MDFYVQIKCQDNSIALLPDPVIQKSHAKNDTRLLFCSNREAVYTKSLKDNDTCDWVVFEVRDFAEGVRRQELHALAGEPLKGPALSTYIIPEEYYADGTENTD